jgi:hypothetical protein
MIAGLAGSVVVMSCLGCTGLNTDSSDIIRINVGPVSGSQSYQSGQPIQQMGDDSPVFNGIGSPDFRLPLKVGNDFSPSNWAQPETAARFKELDLRTPLPIRRERGETVSAEVAFGAYRDQTGLGVDVQVAPRAQFQQDRAGNNIANFGGEVRFGQGLRARDQRHSNTKAPAGYFFVGADNQALVWNVADHQSLDGLALRDQATVGDMQAGLAWSTRFGGQMSLGLVQRKLKFNDITGDHDVNTREQFVAFSFTLKR